MIICVLKKMTKRSLLYLYIFCLFYNFHSNLQLIYKHSYDNMSFEKKDKKDQEQKRINKDNIELMTFYIRFAYYFS